MNIVKLVAVAIWIVLLGGCNTQPTRMEPMAGKSYPPNPPLPVTHCRDLICKVNVNVDIVLLPRFSCTIAVNPPILDLSGGPAIQTIEWTLNTPNFKWPTLADGYLPVQFDQNAQGVISNLSISGNALTITYTRPPNGGNHYGYGVNTRHPVLGKICNVDPWMLD